MIREFDERFEELWRVRHSSFKVVLERSAEYMQWKFIEDPDDVNYAYGAFDNDTSAMLGCMIYRKDENATEIRELIIGQDDPRQRQIASGFLHHLRSLPEESAHMNFLGNERLVTEIRNFGFVERGEGRNVFVGRWSDEIVDSIVLEPNSWLLVKSDEDP